MFPRLIGLAGGSFVLLVSSLSQAQCAKDTDCKAERVCEAGKCVAPPAGQTAAPAAVPRAAAPVVPSTRETGAVAPPKLQRRSPGMMAGGIVMLSLAPVALLVAGIARLGKGVCDLDHSDGYDTCDDYDPTIYGSLISALVLVGGGVPLLVVGAQKEPVDAPMSASIAPWATPTAAGLGLRLQM